MVSNRTHVCPHGGNWPRPFEKAALEFEGRNVARGQGRSDLIQNQFGRIVGIQHAADLACRGTILVYSTNPRSATDQLNRNALGQLATVAQRLATDSEPALASAFTVAPIVGSLFLLAPPNPAQQMSASG